MMKHIGRSSSYLLLPTWLLLAFYSFKLTHTSPVQMTPKTKSIEIRMPGVRPLTPDAYFCTAVNISQEETYITNFEPLTDASRVHHMLLFGCPGLAQTTGYWSCDSICSSGSPSYMYAWGRNAAPTTLPKDVGFRVSGDTNVKSLVLQLHYVEPLTEEEESDYSGVRITTTTKKQKYTAGIYVLYIKHLQIPPNMPGFHGDFSCQYNGRSTLHPFAFRVHAHSMGKVVTAYHNNGSWYMLGKGNPQWPQAFYPIEGNHVIYTGEFLAGRCIFDSTKKKKVPTATLR